MCIDHSFTDGRAHDCAHCRAHGGPDRHTNGSADECAHRRADHEPHCRTHGCTDNGADARANTALRRQRELLRSVEQLVRTMC